MRVLTFLLFFLGLNNLLNSQCSLYSFPNDKSMYDINVCAVDGSFPFTTQLDKEATIHNQVVFHLGDEFYMQHPELLLDFDDGNGFQQITPNGVYTVNYSSGEKIIRQCLEFSGGLNCVEFFRIEVKNPSASYTAPDDIYYLGAGRAYVSLGEGSEEVTKPIIFVEGLDLGTQVLRDPDYNNEIIRWGDRGWDVFTMGAGEQIIPFDPEHPEDSEELFHNTPALMAEFKAAGFDMVLVDFAEGAGDLVANAQVLKELINRVNEEKVVDDDGVLHENIVVGASMGAVISRIALAQMEADDESHCTNTYVSFDGPHKGANIPLGIQVLIWHSATFIDENASDYDRSLREKIWNDIKKPAPQSLIVHNLLGAYQQDLLEININETFKSSANTWWLVPHYFDWYEDLSIDYTAARQSLVDLLDELGYPKQTHNISIANGNATVLNQFFYTNH